MCTDKFTSYQFELIYISITYHRQSLVSLIFRSETFAFSHDMLKWKFFYGSCCCYCCIFDRTLSKFRILKCILLFPYAIYVIVCFKGFPRYCFNSPYQLQLCFDLICHLKLCIRVIFRQYLKCDEFLFTYVLILK